ncbi:hypothetical protein SELMODRAFT_426605 [Selaginella moellendorffii]|uniref:Uncharacterized protein n=1 Tax=Selaginella moellendorffii TaxID=88036 RepID=D8SWX3_SELML|nr:hypothetical protein SELMODRAFT_426605 [Selaginella moellendorffii]
MGARLSAGSSADAQESTDRGSDIDRKKISTGSSADGQESTDRGSDVDKSTGSSANSQESTDRDSGIEISSRWSRYRTCCGIFRLFFACGAPTNDDPSLSSSTSSSTSNEETVAGAEHKDCKQTTEPDSSKVWNLLSFAKRSLRRVSKKKTSSFAARELHRLGFFFDSDLRLRDSLSERLTLEKFNKVVQKMESTVFLSPNAKTARALVILLCGRGELKTLFVQAAFCHFWVIEHVELTEKSNFQQQASFEALLDHVLCAWDLVSATFPDKMLALVAHAYGGTLAIELLKHRGWGALQRLRCIGFCDAQIPDGSLRVLSYDQLKFLEGNAVNWVSSQEPLDKRLCGVSSPDLFGTIKKNPMEHLSSGTTKGDGVVMSAFDSLCNFILSKLDVPDDADREGRDEQSESSAQGV